MPRQLRLPPSQASDSDGVPISTLPAGHSAAAHRPAGFGTRPYPVAPDPWLIRQSQRGSPAVRRAELERRVAAFLVGVLDELGRQLIELTRARHDEPVQAFVLNGLAEVFDVGVEVGGAARQTHQHDVVRPQGIVERPSQLGVAVMLVALKELTNPAPYIG